MVNNFSRWTRTLIRRLPALPPLWPGRCVACAAATPDYSDLCRDCRDDLPWLGTACGHCALPLPQAGLCGVCQRRLPAFDCCRAVLRYAPPASYLINSFKHRGQLSCGRVLAQLWAERLARGPAPIDALVPVPLHWRRRWHRGFNQAEELAQWLSKSQGIPCQNLLRRTRPTPSQQGLTAAERRHNLKGAFRLKGSVQGMHLALVDDVVTTGSTGATLAQLLKRHGAQRVELWCIARTPPPG